jgi:hypothetical protein
MDQSFDTYISQLENYLEIKYPYRSKPVDYPIDKIIVFDPDMVGSDLDFISDLFADELNCSLSLATDYDFTARVNSQTLVIFFCSSGNSEKIKYALNQLIDKKAKVLNIGYENSHFLQTLSLHNHSDFLELPAVSPFLSKSTVLLNLTVGIILARILPAKPDKLLQHIHSLIAFLDAENDPSREIAKQIAIRLFNKKIYIFGPAILKPNLIQLKSQLQKIAKYPSRFVTMSEYTDYELNVIIGDQENTALIFLKNQHLNDAMEYRINLIKKHKLQTTDTLIQIETKRNHLTEEIFYLAYIADLVSWNLKELTIPEPVVQHQTTLNKMIQHKNIHISK